MLPVELLQIHLLPQVINPDQHGIGAVAAHLLQDELLDFGLCKVAILVSYGKVRIAGLVVTAEE